jgi:succinate dehydrogenase/fumarate reductase flavoprotein subunit
MTSQRIVTETEVGKALDWLRDSAHEIGLAKTRAVKADHMLKHIEALMSKASDEKTAEGRKFDARTSDRYVEAMNEDAEAAGELAKLYSLREAASMKIEAWRTEQSNYRAMKL